MTKKNFAPKKTIKLYDAGGDINAKWYIEYYIGKKRIKVYRLQSDTIYSLNTFKTIKERYSYAKRIIAEICSYNSRSNNEVPIEAHKPQISSIEAHQSKALVATKDEKTKGKNIAQILALCLEERKPYLRKKTYQSNCSKIKYFAEFCLNQKIKATISEAEVKLFLDYLKDKARSNTTLNSYRSILSRLFTYAIKHKYITGSNPFAAQPVLKEQRQGCKPYSSRQKKQIKKRVSETDTPLWLCIQLTYYCFIRPGEIKGLRIGDIDFDEAKILVRASISKNGKSEYVVIPDIFWNTLRELGLDTLDPKLYVVGKDGIGSEEQFPVNWIGRRHGKILRSLGYDTGYGGHAFYSWKHTGVIDAVKAGINLRELQLQLRHHSLEEMQHYLRDLGINNAEQVRNLFPEL